jgi:membrane protease YdiL (CAAX protease family)
MTSLRNLILKRPVLSVIIITLAWFVLLMMLSGITSVLLHKEFGDAITTFTAHLLVAICILFLLWRFGWLRPAGVARPGTYTVWIISVAGTVYFTFASLWSLYGSFALGIPGVADLSVSGNIILTNIAVCMDEEVLFRGLILYILIQCWSGSAAGNVRSVILTSVIFALLHILQILFWGLSPVAAIFLVLETLVIATWWASMVLRGGSIWPAFLAHFIINTVVALQGSNQAITGPESTAYFKLFLFSLPLGIYALWMIKRLPGHQQGQSSS